MTDIGQMVRSANPVSDDSTLTDAELDALLLLVDTRSGTMETKERLAPIKAPTPKRTPWLVAAAAFVVVLVIGAAVLLTLPGGEETDPAEPTRTTAAPTPTTTAPETTIAASNEQEPPVETTESFAASEASPDQLAMAQQLTDARNAGDFDAWRALLVEVPIVNMPLQARNLPTSPQPDSPEFELGRVRDSMAFEAILNAEWTLGDCQARGSATSFACQLSYTDDLANAVGQVWEFELVLDGGLGSVDRYELFVDSRNQAETWYRFLVWLDGLSPEDALVAGGQHSGYQNDSPDFGWVPNWDEAGARVVAEYLDAYMLTMAQQLVDARNSGDFDAWRSLLTSDADLAGPFSVRDLATGGSEDIDFELDKVRDAMAFETALNAEWTLDACRVADWTEATSWSTTVTQDSGRVISCGLTYTDDLVNAGTQGDFEFEMIVRGSPGAVDVYEIHYRSVDVAHAAWDPFLIWLETQSLDDALIAGRVESGHRDEAWRGWVPKWTEASGNIVASYLDAYIAASG